MNALTFKLHQEYMHKETVMVIGIGAFIVLALLAAVVCARAGSGLGSVFFFGLALVLFVSTPMGEGVPGAVMDFVSGLGENTGPTLKGEQ